MSAGVTVTPEMVLQVAQVRRGMAERIAAYATLRLAGALPVDARRELEVTDRTGGRYERLLPALRARFDLPAPRESRRDWAWTGAGQKGRTW